MMVLELVSHPRRITAPLWPRTEVEVAGERVVADRQLFRALLTDLLAMKRG